MPPGPPIIIRNPCAIKSLCVFTEFFDSKKKAYVRQFGYAKSECKAIIPGSMSWSSILKKIGHTQIHEWVKKSIYNCILQHPQILQSTIANDCLKVYLIAHSEPQLV